MTYRWLVGEWRTVGFVAVSTLLVYVSAVTGMRMSERRTLAEMSAFDFVVAVALGAVVGRTATTAAPSYIQGLTAIATLVVVHRLVGWARIRSNRFRQTLDRPSVIVVDHGQVIGQAMRRAHLTDADLHAVLRQHRVARLDEIEVLVMEANGRFSVILRDGPPLDPRLDPRVVVEGG